MTANNLDGDKQALKQAAVLLRWYASFDPHCSEDDEARTIAAVLDRLSAQPAEPKQLEHAINLCNDFLRSRSGKGYWGDGVLACIEIMRSVNHTPLEVQEADMCPNCVTPWKCNGPHIAAPPAAQNTGDSLPASVDHAAASRDRSVWYNDPDGFRWIEARMENGYLIPTGKTRPMTDAERASETPTATDGLPF